MPSTPKSPLSLSKPVPASEVTREERLISQELAKNRSPSKVARFSIMAILLVAVSLGSAYVGAKLMVKYQSDVACCNLSPLRSAVVSIKEQLGLVRFYSHQMGQDKWVSEAVFPGVRDGFFVDVGSGDGTANSNTKALEEKGWSGICIDAFPRGMEPRTCHVVQAVVFSEAGQWVKFWAGGDWGGIIDPLMVTKERMQTYDAPIVEFRTETLGDILDRAKAPPFIEYMSMDIEGAEVPALKGLPFDKYQLGALTIEHNFLEPKRSEIKTLMENHGYKRVWTSDRDDFYVQATSLKSGNQ